MGRLGSGLIRTAIAALAVALCAHAAAGVGIGFGIDLSTLDLSIAFTKVAPAAEEAFDAVYQALVDLGLPPSDLDDARDQFEDGLSTLKGAIDRLPALIPIPYLSLSVGIPLHLVGIDDLRLSAGFISDSILYALADRFGFELPPLQFDRQFELDGNTGSVTGSVAFSSFLLSTEVTKRLDLFVFSIDLMGGVHLTSGAVRPDIEVAGTPGLQEGLEAALGALHPEGLSWSSFGVHVGGGIEIADERMPWAE